MRTEEEKGRKNVIFGARFSKSPNLDRRFVGLRENRVLLVSARIMQRVALHPRFFADAWFYFKFKRMSERSRERFQKMTDVEKSTRNFLTETSSLSIFFSMNVVLSSVDFERRASFPPWWKVWAVQRELSPGFLVWPWSWQASNKLVQSYIESSGKILQ